MSMKSAKEFALWLKERFGDCPQGLYFTKDDIKDLSGRHTFRQDFIADVHSELARHQMCFISDALKENYFMMYLPKVYWKDHKDRYAEKPKVHLMPVSTQKQR